ncbi:MAG: FKBP-type peptidyl-prolyl cis-trans isomerase [Oceanicaulis sp.]
MFRLRLTASAAVLALGLAACGDDADDEMETGAVDSEMGMDAAGEDPAMDGGMAEQGGADGETANRDRSASQDMGGAGRGEPMRAGAEPSEEVMQIVSQARDCQTEQSEMDFSAEEQGEGQDEASYNAQVSDSYLQQNRDRECVFELPSGLQFTITNAVEDGLSPNAGELVRVNYEGKLVSGETFDSSYERGEPAVFPSDRLISGWVEALPLMRVGEEWSLFIPPELGYGQRGTPGGPIGPNQALIFRIELLGLPGRDQAGQSGMSGQDGSDGMSEDGSGSDAGQGEGDTETDGG